MFGRKKTKLFGNHIEVKCEYCESGSEDDGASVCKLNCTPEPDGSCPRFSYDPLKRAPKNSPVLRPHDVEEFKL